MGQGGEPVLCLPGKAELCLVELGRRPHRDAVEGTGQRVLVQCVDHPSRTVLGALAVDEQQVRVVIDSNPPAKADELVGVRDGAQPQQAELVQCGRRNLETDTSLDGRLTCRVGPDAGLDDIAHDHGVNILGRDVGAGEGLANGDGSEVGGAQSGEAAEQASDGSAAPAMITELVTGCTKRREGGKGRVSTQMMGRKRALRHRLGQPTNGRSRFSSSRAIERRWTASGPSTMRRLRAQA